MATLRTLAESFRYEIDKVKGSRFIATAAPVGSPENALAFVESIRRKFHDATHNCFAWRIAPGKDLFRYSDDGEPSGTAGRPILQEIDGRGLENVTVVVTRYYGGTKLGTGGLLRAYGGAAAEALDLAKIIETRIVHPVLLTFPYALTGSVQGVLSAFALQPTQADYGEAVRMTVETPIEDVERLRLELSEATAGKIGIRTDSQTS